MQIRSPAIDHQALATVFLPSCEKPDLFEVVPVEPEIQHVSLAQSADEGEVVFTPTENWIQ
eukprot:1609805-Pyramimonas_sp.AAC.1